MHSENLFTNYSQAETNAPLADKLRTKNLLSITEIIRRALSMTT